MFVCCWLAGWLVGLSEGLPQNLNGGWVSAQNRLLLTIGANPDKGMDSGFSLSLTLQVFIYFGIYESVIS